MCTKLQENKSTSKEEFERQVNEKAEALANERATIFYKDLMKKLGE